MLTKGNSGCYKCPKDTEAARLRVPVCVIGRFLCVKGRPWRESDKEDSDVFLSNGRFYPRYIYNFKWEAVCIECMDTDNWSQWPLYNCCFYCSATNVMSQVLQHKSINKQHKGSPHIHLALLCIFTSPPQMSSVHCCSQAHLTKRLVSKFAAIHHHSSMAPSILKNCCPGFKSLS